MRPVMYTYKGRLNMFFIITVYHGHSTIKDLPFIFYNKKKLFFHVNCIVQRSSFKSNKTIFILLNNHV